MSLTSRISDLAGAIRDKFNAITPRLIPAGGSSGQVLIKGPGADYDAGWQTVAGAGPGNLVISEEQPANSCLWLQLNVGGDQEAVTLNYVRE